MVFIVVFGIGALEDSKTEAVSFWVPPLLVGLALGHAPGAAVIITALPFVIAWSWLAARGVAGWGDPAAVGAYILHAGGHGGSHRGLIVLGLCALAATGIALRSSERRVRLYPVLLAATVIVATLPGGAP